MFHSLFPFLSFLIKLKVFTIFIVQPEGSCTIERSQTQIKKFHKQLLAYYGDELPKFPALSSNSNLSDHKIVQYHSRALEVYLNKLADIEDLFQMKAAKRFLSTRNVDDGESSEEVQINQTEESTQTNASTIEDE